MFELSKKILQKVSFDRALFRKELIKSLRLLKSDEKMTLKVWCLSTFGVEYHQTIIEVFRTFARV